MKLVKSQVGKSMFTPSFIRFQELFLQLRTNVLQREISKPELLKFHYCDKKDGTGENRDTPVIRRWE